VGKLYVMNFEWALANYMGRPGASCHHQPTCGKAVVIEHNGDVYACDHYVYPEFRLGNITTSNLTSMVDLPAQTRFGMDKLDTLPQQCRRCNMVGGCWGGCPKHRFVMSADNEPGLNYLCKGYHQFFTHSVPYLKALSQIVASGRPASRHSAHDAGVFGGASSLSWRLNSRLTSRERPRVRTPRRSHHSTQAGPPRA
jgi:uncharacterized protein